jgi:hypothetical protein
MEPLPTPPPSCFLALATTGPDPVRDRVLGIDLRAGSDLDLPAGPMSTAEALADRIGALGPGPVAVAAHGAAAARAFLAAWAGREGVALPDLRWTCTWEMARWLVPGAGFGLDLAGLAGMLGWSPAPGGAALTARLWEALAQWAWIREELGPRPGIVYLAGPFRGDGSRPAMAHNQARMADLSRFVQAVLPDAALVVPHLNFAYLDEAGPGGAGVRDRVLAACATLVRASGALVLCGDELTSGMRRELDAALEAGLPVFGAPGWDPPGRAGAGAEPARGSVDFPMPGHKMVSA